MLSITQILWHAWSPLEAEIKFQGILLLLKHLRLHCRHPNTSSLNTLACSSPNQECSLKLSIWIWGFLKWWSHVLESSPDLMDFNAQNVPDLTDTLFKSAAMSFRHVPFAFWALPYFSGTTRCFHPVSALGSAAAPKSPGFFHWRMVVISQTWALVWFLLMGYHCFWGLFSG